MISEITHHNPEQEHAVQTVSAEIQAHQLERIASQKEALTNSAEIRQTVLDVAAIRHTNGDPNMPDYDPNELVDYSDFEGVQSAMRQAFDFRTRDDGSYGERVEAEGQANKYLYPGLSEEKAQEIYHAAELFGLTGDTVPRKPEVEAAIVLGGAAKSPLDRTRYVKELLDSGQLKTNIVVSLGSERPVDDAERQRTGDDYAKDAKTEFDLMVAAAEKTFSVKASEENLYEWTDPDIVSGVPNKHKILHIPASEEVPDIFIISSAVVTDSWMKVKVGGKEKDILRNRANTEDSLATVARMLKPGDVVAAFTNAHFKPFQGAAASGQLGALGIDAEVVGFDPTHFGNPPKRSDELLQEMLSTADSLARIK